jgi:hypothetical protein
MTRPFPDKPPHPERVCWGCDRYCTARDLQCGNGSVRTPHPCELFGDDWRSWQLLDTLPHTSPSTSQHTSSDTAPNTVPDEPKLEPLQGHAPTEAQD